MRRFYLLLVSTFFLFIITSCKKGGSNDPITQPDAIATSITLLSNDKYLVTDVNTPLPDEIIVQVLDQYQEPFKGHQIEFTISEGLLSNTSITTDNEGKANITWTLGIGATQELEIKSFKSDSETHLSGSPIKINASTTLPNIEDYDGNKYSLVRIGKQIWFKENLRTTKYSNGASITLVEDNVTWENLLARDKAYCFYNNCEDSDKRYGALYTYAAATNGKELNLFEKNGIQGACPEGWHIPTRKDWQELQEYLGGQNIAGGVMKDSNSDIWYNSNLTISNSSGFSALPGGYRYKNGNFVSKGFSAEFWSTDKCEECMNCVEANWWIGKSTNGLYYGGGGDGSQGRWGFSIRCVINKID